MRKGDSAWLIAVVAIAIASGASSAHAQRGSADSTLEIAPRVAPPGAIEPAPRSDDGVGNDRSAPPADGVSTDRNAYTADLIGSTQQAAAATNDKLPYLGIAVQPIFSNDRPGKIVAGLEVVSVDRESPAERAGLRGRTGMTSLGESGTTAGALVPPLDLVVMPLLKKAGALGQGGDLIVAIDDKRVENDLDLQSTLATLKPGDTIYLTIERSLADGAQKTLKLPVKLGDASRAAVADGQATATSANSAK